MAPQVAPSAPAVDRAALKPLMVPLGCLFGVLLLWNLRRLTLGEVPGFPLDDPYITLHNAQVLLSGKPDPVYVGTPPLAGSTSAVHTVLVALLCLVFKPEAALDATQWIALFAYALGLVRLAQANHAGKLQTGLVVAVGLLAAKVPLHLFNGLETGLGMAALTWALVLANDSKRRSLFAALLGTLPFVRPELALVSVALGIHLLRQKPQKSEMIRCGVAAAAAALPWLLLNHFAAGSVLPGTIAAKDSFFAVSSLPLSERAFRFWRGVRQEAIPLGPGALLLLLAPFARVGKPALAAFVAVLALYLLKLPMAIESNSGRYWHLFAPLLALGAAAPLRWRRIPVAVAVAAVVATFSLFGLRARLGTYANAVSWTNEEVRQTAEFCRDQLPRDSVVMIHDAGVMGFLSERRLVDLVGLKTPDAAQVHHEITLPSNGKRRGDAMVEIARRSHATHLVVLGEWEGIFGIGQAFVDHGWRMRVLKKPHAAYDYAVYSIAPPGS